MSFDDFVIVYFGTDLNAENKTSSHHVALQLAKTNKVLYVDSPGLRSPKLNSRDLKKTFLKLKKALLPPQAVGKNMWYIIVPQLPFRRVPLIKTLNRFVGWILVKKALRMFRTDKLISWFATPDLAPLAKHLNEQFSLYYCTDKHEHLPDIDSVEVSQLDEEITKKADLVVCVGELVCIEKKKINPNCIYVPHGVDFDRFERARSSDLPLPDIKYRLKPPIIGYYGSIAEWLDLDLLTKIAQSRSDCTLLLIGHSSIDISELSRYSNIVLIGPQPYQTLPSWAKLFDVAIYPAKKDHGFVRYANPLKIREYLAAGKEVVSVSTHEISKLSPPVRTADTHEEFLEQLDDVLSTRSFIKNNRMDEELKKLSWNYRVLHIKENIDKTLSEKM